MGGLEALEIDRRVQARMDRGDVIALHEIVRIGLPVAGDIELYFLEAGEAFHRIGGGQFGQIAQGRFKRPGIVV